MTTNGTDGREAVERFLEALERVGAPAPMRVEFLPNSPAAILSMKDRDEAYSLGKWVIDGVGDRDVWVTIEHYVDRETAATWRVVFGFERRQTFETPPMRRGL